MSIGLQCPARSLADEVIERGHAAVERLRQDPFFGRLISGEVNRDEYVAWLVQMHRWIRHAIRALRGHADAMAARAYRDRSQAPFSVTAHRHHDEEIGHDELILDDLAVLFSCNKEEVLGRIEREPAAPSVCDWERLLDGMLARFPMGMLGIALAIETISGSVVDEILRNLPLRSNIEGIERAVSFLRAHSSEVEEGHLGSSQIRVDALRDVADRNAVLFYGCASLAMFEGMSHYLALRFGPRD